MWHPISSAPKYEHVIVRGIDGIERQSYWGKVSHIPVFGWLDFSDNDPENTDLLKPEPTEWRLMIEGVDEGAPDDAGP